MLSSISWQQYLSVLAILLICYYAYIGYRYFGWELLSFVGIKRVAPGKVNISADDLKTQMTSESYSDNLPKEFIDTNVSSSISSFEDEVRAYLLESAHLSKEEILASIRKIVVKYPDIEKPDNRKWLTELLISETTKNTRYDIGFEDIQQLWR